MIGYVVLGTNDLARAASFYDDAVGRDGRHPDDGVWRPRLCVGQLQWTNRCSA